MHKTQIGFLMFIHESAKARLTIWNDQTATVSGVYSRVRGKGYANVVMQELIEYAEINLLTLSLDVQQYGPNTEDAPSNLRLAKFYNKFGFKIVGDTSLPIQMVRPLEGMHFAKYCFEHNSDAASCKIYHDSARV